jgi:hypothetical protein
MIPMTLVCHKPTGISKYGDEIYADVCHRLRFHVGGCKPDTVPTRIHSYYEINRTYWPDMARLRAFYSAVRSWWMCRKA